MYIQREVKEKIKVLEKGFPVISVTGPRQSGKTTFLRYNYPKYKYFNFEDPVTLQTIKDDPVGFFEENPSKIILDEVQRLPEILSYIQVLVDERKEMGSILLSGSQNLLVSEKVSQTLAGRAAYQVMYPLSFSELEKAKLLKKDRFDQMLKGGYPSLYTREVTPSIYFQQYIATYTERDVRQIRNVSELSQFQRFMGLLAGRVGQLVNVSSLASDAGISPNTAEDWLSILEASYIIFRLQPYFSNIGKRLIKSPKLFFTDTGLLLALLNVNSRESLKNHYLLGGLFENFVISEFLKGINNSEKLAKLYFFRDSHGNEVDLVIDNGDIKIPVEIKSSSSYHSSFLKGLQYWNENVDASHSGYLIYAGQKEFIIQGRRVISWKNLGDLM